MEIDYRDENMKRIADALEEILRLVKEDQERSRRTPRSASPIRRHRR